MNCPSCGLEVPDGALSCPHCHAPLDLTQRLTPLDKVFWCPSCGALISVDDELCPKCGAPTGAVINKRSVRDLDLPEIGDEPSPSPMAAGEGDGAGEASQAHIESAIPDPSSDTPAARGDSMPKTRSFITAAVLAVAMVALVAYVVTHPVPVSSSSADVGSSSSSDSSVTVLEYLSGQDKSQTSSTSSDDTVFASIQEAYEELGTLAEEMVENEELLRSDGISSDADARSDGQSACTSLSLQISNLISEISSLDDGAGTYSEDIGNLSTLGNWLRNYSDALSEAWGLSVDSSDPEEDASSILAPLTALADSSGTNSYLALFNEYYEGWLPEQS